MTELLDANVNLGSGKVAIVGSSRFGNDAIENE